LDFVFFFLVFLPAMDGVRNMKLMDKQTRLILSFGITALIGSYFGYQSMM